MFKAPSRFTVHFCGLSSKKCCAGAFSGFCVGHSLGNAEKVLRGECAKNTNTNPEIRGDASRWTPCMRDSRRNYVGHKLRNPRTKVKNRGSRTKQLVVMVCWWSSFHRSLQTSTTTPRNRPRRSSLEALLH
jgi:hypothetical protein